MPYIWLVATVYCALTDMHVLNLAIFLFTVIWYPVTDAIASYEESDLAALAWVIAFDEYDLR